MVQNRVFAPNWDEEGIHLEWGVRAHAGWGRCPHRKLTQYKLQETKRSDGDIAIKGHIGCWGGKHSHGKETWLTVWETKGVRRAPPEKWFEQTNGTHAHRKMNIDVNGYMSVYMYICEWICKDWQPNSNEHAQYSDLGFQISFSNKPSRALWRNYCFQSGEREKFKANLKVLVTPESMKVLKEL